MESHATQISSKLILSFQDGWQFPDHSSISFVLLEIFFHLCKAWNHWGLVHHAWGHSKVVSSDSVVLSFMIKVAIKMFLRQVMLRIFFRSFISFYQFLKHSMILMLPLVMQTLFNLFLALMQSFQILFLLFLLLDALRGRWRRVFDTIDFV